jgi:hypothetical protein
VNSPWSCEKIEDRLFPERSVRRSARSTRWNARSARVFGCGFKTVSVTLVQFNFFTAPLGNGGISRTPALVGK